MLNYQSNTLPKVAAHRRTLSSITTKFSPEDSRSSSLNKVWAEDYYSDGNRDSSNTREEILTPPAPATLTERPFPKSIALSDDEEPSIPRQPRTHQRSLTALLPFRPHRDGSSSPQRSPQRSPERSPTKEKIDFDFMPTLTGDKNGQIRIAEKPKGGLSGWFSGSSAPMNVGVPIDQTEEFETVPMDGPATGTGRSPSPERTPTKLRKKSVVETLQQHTTKPASASTSRFAFFSSPKTPTQQTVQINSKLDDEYLSLDIGKALFPSGDPAEQDPFSPSAFINLLTNAEGLLNKLQTAYKLRTLALHEIAAEKDAQSEELEEAETRAKHLKLQLENMATKVFSQDQEMIRLKAELAAERKARTEEREAREKSISLIKFNRPSPIEERRRFDDIDHDENRSSTKTWRHSNGTINSDTSFESDDESAGAESVFSRSMSPTLTSVSEASSTPEVRQAAFAKVVAVEPSMRGAERPKTVQQRSTFQKILKGITIDSSEESLQTEKGDELGISEEGCRNCRGGPSSVAWDTVGLLKVENKGLKERVESLDKAVDAALDLVRGVGGIATRG